MANRETYPASQSPLLGDISGPAGATTVTVVGLQRTSMDSTPPNDQDALVYQLSSNKWVPTADANQSIAVNGVKVSDDYDIGFNLILGANISPVLVNGV